MHVSTNEDMSPENNAIVIFKQRCNALMVQWDCASPLEAQLWKLQ
jgi:hypothetical protein